MVRFPPVQLRPGVSWEWLGDGALLANVSGSARTHEAQNNERNTMSNEIRPIALDADGATKALGISRETFDREVGPNLDWFELGGSRLVSYAALERWIAHRARGQHEIRTKEAA